MKKLFTVAAVAAMALGIASCTKVGPGGNDNGFGDKTRVDLVINTNAGGNSRAEGDLKNGTIEESKVTTLEIYVYNSTGTTLDPAVNAGTTPGYAFIDAPTMTAMMTGVHDGRFTTTLDMSAGTAQVLAVFNAGLGSPSTIASQLGLG
ncbi:MAG: hypothetical protein LBU97_00770, partial [Alistipes sp.]|nr:hypothetical protein [Alistipes sp.]